MTRAILSIGMALFGIACLFLASRIAPSLPVQPIAQMNSAELSALFYLVTGTVMLCFAMLVAVTWERR